ncbi:MAG TPA: PQQ-dependent sugar dehydrogenase, partial [Gammaproteobacteria bacterium]|nr:PQQ-dependent sugar dehydrogenase [Gammaproteobacteria bacterium]
MLDARSVLLAAALVCAASAARADDENASWTFDTYTPGPCSANGSRHGGCPAGELVRIHVVTMAYGLVRPWHIAFLPGGSDMLVTELPGQLRIVRGGKLDSKPIPGWPAEALSARSLNSVVLHPDFERNRTLYFSYVKQRDGGDTTVALARGRFDGTKLTNIEDVFVADAWGTGATAGRAELGPDGMLYLTVGDRDAGNTTDDPSFRMKAQDLSSHVGKVLRLRDDGTAAPGNPFAGRKDAKPEIYTYGHRNVQGLAWHPRTGELWATEIGPMGGDELNLLGPGHNYGWPLVTLGKIYTGHLASEQPWSRPGMDNPQMFW